MSCSVTTATLFVVSVISALLILTANAANPIGHRCGTSKNFTVGSEYELNLNKLIGLINYRTQPNGYGQGSTGRAPDRVYGLGLCRGDVSSLDCLRCISDAGVKVRKLCVRNKRAIVWYDHCMLKYSGRKFFGNIDNTKVILCNIYNVTVKPALFNRIKVRLLRRLSKAASANSKRYASGKNVVDGSTTIYGMAECTRDLTTNDCKKCLDSEIDGYLLKYCPRRIGAQVLGGSCIVRYETYPFLKKLQTS